MKRVKRCLICLLTLLLIAGCSANTQKVKEGNVYYEIFVRSFYDSDGDGIGDINGIREKLDYLDDLGISGIWLMPIMPSETYHKYDVDDYYSIDESYGTMEDFEALVQEAKEHNIDIIIDLVLNHTSDTNEWFVTAKNHLRKGTCDEIDSYCDYYNFSDSREANYYSVPGSSYFYEAVFWDEMPDLNLDSENVRNEIVDIVDFWMKKGIKGFRLDAVLHYYEGNTAKNVKFLTWFTDLVKSYDEDAYIVDEAWTSSETYAKYFESGSSAFDFELSQSDGAIVKNIRNGSGANLTKRVVDYEALIHNYDEEAVNSVFVSNHDQGRSGAFFAADEDATKFMANVYLMMPGIPFIYYGEEIGMLGSGKDENKRLSFVWSDEDSTGMCSVLENSDYTNRRYEALDVQQKDKNSLFNHYKKVIEVRNRYSSLVDGESELYDTGNDAIYAVISRDENEEILVMHNFSTDVMEVTVNEYSLDATITLSNDKVTLKTNTLSLPGRSTAVLKKE